MNRVTRHGFDIHLVSPRDESVEEYKSPREKNKIFDDEELDVLAMLLARVSCRTGSLRLMNCAQFSIASKLFLINMEK